MNLCGKNDLAYSGKLLSLCSEIKINRKSPLRAQTAALAIEGMIDGLWQNFLIGPPGFKRAQAVTTVFELLEIIYPEESHNIRRFVISSV